MRRLFVGGAWLSLGMASKSKGQKRRKHERRATGNSSLRVDQHTATLLESLQGLGGKFLTLSGAEDPRAAAEQQLNATVDALASKVRVHNRFRFCEGVRLACLPWSFGGQARPGTDGGATKAELLTLIAFADRNSWMSAGDVPVSPEFEDLEAGVTDIIQLATVEQFIAAAVAEQPDPMAKILAASRGREVWIRNSSYPDMVEATLLQLFGTPAIQSALKAAVGFGVVAATEVLKACHQLQVDAMNQRMRDAFSALEVAALSSEGWKPSDQTRTEIRSLWEAAWEPDEHDVTVDPAEIAASAGVDIATVTAVANHFRLAVDDWPPLTAAREFTSGNNPLRTNPLLMTEGGRMMLVHDALILPAVRENLEQVLKSTTTWEVYQAHRGKVLEQRTAQCLNRVLPGSRVWDGFEYFVPATEAESGGEASRYSKLVEGDLLLVLGDVALVIEAKAVALAPRARAGDTRRLRNDLTRIVRDAGDQARRLKSILNKDRGFRLRNGSWVDLSEIREIHTVAVSLDDLSGVATTTADLIAAGLLDSADIPWTVSLHDLELICEIVELPAAFLLYLRRRRDPEVTIYYTAPDELDLFMYFLEAGLYVEPDPARTRQELSFVTKVRAADVKRRNRQRRAIITSRTDPLDAWYYHDRGQSSIPAEKPALQHAPMKTLAGELQMRGDEAWLSIGAALLSASTRTQTELLHASERLLELPDDGREHTLTTSIGATREDAWLIVWATRPVGAEPSAFAESMKKYVGAKKYQLQLSRACMLISDQQTKELAQVLYDATVFTPDPDMDALVAELRLIDPKQHPRRIPQELR